MAHRCEWRAVKSGGMVDFHCAGCDDHMSLKEIERRLNAVECLSAKGARAIVNVFPVDALIAYAATLEADAD